METFFFLVSNSRNACAVLILYTGYLMDQCHNKGLWHGSLSSSRLLAKGYAVGHTIIHVQMTCNQLAHANVVFN